MTKSTLLSKLKRAQGKARKVRDRAMNTTPNQALSMYSDYKQRKARVTTRPPPTKSKVKSLRSPNNHQSTRGAQLR